MGLHGIPPIAPDPSSPNPPMFARVRLNGFWEVLPLAGGDVLCVHSFDGQLRLRAPHVAVVDALEQVESGVDEEALLCAAESQHGAAGRAAVAVAIARLVDMGVLIRSREPAAASPTAAARAAGRYDTLRDWLAIFSPEDYGAAAFERLRASRVAMIGLGGAGSVCAAMLAASGVGWLTLVDGDCVSPSNLTRQIFYTEADAEAGNFKARALAARLESLNGGTVSTPVTRFVTSVADAREFVRGHDLVILTADAPRILLTRWVNRACVVERCALIYCFLGQVGPMFVPGRSACFGCVEAAWRAESGLEYDEIVEALQRRHTREYPSLASGPVRVGELLFSEALAQLSGIVSPRTLDGTVRVGPGGETIVPVPPSEQCAECAPYRRDP
jgi:hypothetical protein